MPSNKIWLRAETKPAEARSALTPTTCKALIDAGYEVTVERSTQRIFDDEEFAKVGAPLVEEGSWVKDAPKDAYVLGLKELPEDDFPLEHVHISFAHCYKQQGGWEKVLSRWPRGGGVLLDLEFLQDESGRRVAAFGWSAGYAGSALAVKNWAWQLTHPEGEPLHGEEPYANQDLLIKSVKESLEAGKKQSGRSPKVLVIGALGRCGNGAVQLAKDVGIPESDIIQWDMAETKKGGPFKEIIEDADIFVNCIYLSSPIPPFVTPESLATPNRRLSVICDVSADTTNPHNPIPVYNITTTFDKPTVPVTLPAGTQGPPLSVISIDHLPSLLPRESSEQFSQALLPSLLQLKDRENARVWKQAEDLFQEKVATLPESFRAQLTISIPLELPRSETAMQEKSTTVAAYAAGASLAAVALFYVFGPNYTIDGDESSDSGRKKSIVGLSNPANDCFINSVLQALAGLGELRVYLIRELHRRELDGLEIYSLLPPLDEIPRDGKPDKIRELQQGTITRALKEMLDRLNERPIYKKTISARPFIQSLEYAYRTRISRSQQDAQEFLQIVAERLCDEYHAGVKARLRAKGIGEPNQVADSDNELPAKSPTDIEVRIDDGSPNGLPAIIDTKLKEIENEHSFPFEGKLESQIECQFCHYKYKPNQTSFVNLTLQVPQKSSTTLSACFDGLLKTEYIDDFKCDRCRLQHALDIKKHDLTRARSGEEGRTLEVEIERIQTAISTDPEGSLEGVSLPPSELAPKRKIARHMRIVAFPKIIAIHLSRSIFDQSSSSKNAAKVSFPERLPLGGILSQKWYRLLAIVSHKGSHNSGHYESFRRNHLYAPFSTPDAFSSYAQSRATSENPSEAPSPRLGARQSSGREPSALSISTPSEPPSHSSQSSPAPSRSTSSKESKASSQSNAPLSPTTRPTTSSSRLSFQSNRSRSTTSKPNLSPVSDPLSPANDGGRWSKTFSRTSLTSDQGTQPTTHTAETSVASSFRHRRRRKQNDRWWRISDEKVKECKTSDVLGMQKEVYLLFYELERPNTSA
ncbi:bifunctional saccharopine dehydrogenase/ubiquitin carboxyl-terminal hydrolase [Aspergillus fijiensis CBS 313.89]|uniref:Saccharopine dehydrogenase [NAD(+), L-lysine-forming] n=1 Tax=Aspergillus fijiensis CBS 313.89 TaxID=1448319 RepID=A0A8G1RIJ5_9EURO|nr:cysteine proteinase [Aspergillus fijiensis CBS 313.89]RAK72758.1 cysteine proteinase [Aspergillus fijiensis CBS 313.89]